jgi:hypothetical protein
LGIIDLGFWAGMGRGLHGATVVYGGGCNVHARGVELSHWGAFHTTCLRWMGWGLYHLFHLALAEDFPCGVLPVVHQARNRLYVVARA